MNQSDLLQAIVLLCEAEGTLDGEGEEEKFGRRCMAKEILEVIEASRAEEKWKADKSLGLAGLVMSRPLVTTDLETTAKEVGEARIIEFAAVKIHPDGRRETLEFLIHPGFEISAEIEELTGITNADLVGALPFLDYAEAIWNFLAGADFMGYGGRNYDAPVLWEEFNRIGWNWEIRQEEILDPLEIFQEAEPRSLTGAARFYLGADHEGAHRAMPDVEMTLRVLNAQLLRYQSLPASVEELILATKRDRRVDMAGKIALNDEGVPCFTFGDSTKGKPVTSNANFANWMLGKNFPEQTKRVVRLLLGHDLSDNPYR